MPNIPKRSDQQELVAKLLESYGIDLSDPNFKDTPRRIDSAFRELMSSRFIDLSTELDRLFSATFPCDYDQMVTVKKIISVGLCPHHFLPVNYEFSIGIIPNKSVLGLSKFARVVNLLAARPIMQEQLTNDIKETFKARMDCKGIIVVGSGWHSCLSLRGAKAMESKTITSAVDGIFAVDRGAKAEFLDLINKDK